jgi:hypothetical protein
MTAEAAGGDASSSSSSSSSSSDTARERLPWKATSTTKMIMMMST